MSNKFSRILSGALASIMVFLSGCSNGDEVKAKGKIKSDVFSSDIPLDGLKKS